MEYARSASTSRDIMTTTQTGLHKVERREIQSAREALLLKLLSPETDVKIRQRTFIKELMAEIKALRTLGVDFDEIALTLKDFGCKLSGDTLRQYYYEEKRDQDEEALHSVAERYTKAAESVLTDYHMIIGRNLDSLVKRAVDEASAKKLSPTLPVKGPVAEHENKNAPAAAASTARRVSEGADDDEVTDKKTIAELLNNHVSDSVEPVLPKVVSDRNKDSPTPQEVESILTSPVDITNIPERDKPDKKS